MRTLVTVGITIAVVAVLVHAEHPAVRTPIAEDGMPLPFTRALSAQKPVMNGDDVFMAQNLLNRSPYVTPIQTNRNYDAATAQAVNDFRVGNGLGASTIFDAETASLLLELHLDNDGYKDDGLPLPPGILYKVYVPVWRNRSIEVTATLYDRNLSIMRQYTLRTHGQNDADGNALNQWTSNGNTPTGLSLFDLNSPEDDPKSYGPYPVNRFVQGLKGNQAVVIPNIRDGILQHTGEWPNWNPSMPMPNSNGCMHGHPVDIMMVWQILVNELSVQVRNNTDGALPYPYVPQGLVSVELQDP